MPKGVEHRLDLTDESKGHEVIYSLMPSRVLSSSRDGSIQVTKERTKGDPTPFTIVRLAEIPNVVDAIISPNGAKLATKSSRGVFEIWDVATLTQSNGN